MNYLYDKSLSEKINKFMRQKNLARKLESKEISLESLTKNEIDEMLEYYMKHIKEQKEEIDNLKNMIKKIRKEI